MRVLITAGPTREPIDAVRFISNRSSGRMGLALAAAAAEAGHQVTLLLGPVAEPVDLPKSVHLVRFVTAADLQTSLLAHFDACDWLIMAAAVADYRPVRPTAGKLPRSHQPGSTLHLELEPTPDLVAQLAAHKRPGQKIIAFALEEPEHLQTRAFAKLQSKGVDAIVANPLSTMESDAIQMLWITPDGRCETAPPMSKADAAQWILARIPHL